MLDMIDLRQKLDKDEYRAIIEPLELRLGELQRAARELGIPVAIVFEGPEASGKGTLINRLLLALDPRGYTVHLTKPPTEEEAFRPYLWRFWQRTPAHGRIAIFDRSWHTQVLERRALGQDGPVELAARFDEINAFERQLADDGTVLIKFYLHISRKEQAERFRELERNKATRWKVTKEDWRQHKHYNDYREAAEEIFRGTGRVPWTIVEAHDRRFAVAKVFRAVAEALAQAVEGRRGGRARVAGVSPAMVLADTGRSVLARVKLNQDIRRERYEQQIGKLQERLWELQHRAYVERVPVVVVYEGCDAAGKGGSIRRLVQGLDPRGYEVVPVAAPNEVEKAHHYLWRFWNRFPKAGHITVFDRSWYGRVMVERVEGFCTEQEWKRAYAEINETEKQWIDYGAVIIKFWLQIDKEEQLARFRERESTTHKQWKITAEDWRNRKKWKTYQAVVDEMLSRTSTPHAPWTIVEANNKHFARVKALSTVAGRLEKRLG